MSWYSRMRYILGGFLWNRLACTFFSNSSVKIILPVSRDTGKPKEFGALNLSYASVLNIYFRLSRFKSSLLLIHFRYAGEYLFRLHQTETQNLSDMWRSTFEIGAAPLRSITEITSKSSFLCEQKPYFVRFLCRRKLERFSIECRKAKTKVITSAN